MTASLIRGDACAIPLADDSVDLIVTSPPYFALRSYTDGGEHYAGQIGSEPTPAAFLEALWAVTAECRRVLKPSGSMFVNLGDKYVAHPTGHLPDETMHDTSGRTATYQPGLGQNPYGMPRKSLMGMPWRYAIGCIDQLSMILRAEIVWSKPNGLPESVTDRVRRSHEQWFHFTREPRYYAAVDEIREAHAESERPHVLTWEQRKGREDDAARYSDQNGHGGTAGMAQNPLGKLPGSVWSIPSEPLRVPDHIGVDHFAAFPQEWPRRLILGWSPPGYCVECGEPRRAVVDVDWSTIPHEMVRKRVLSSKETADWCGAFSDWCDARDISRSDLDAAAGTSDMGGWWASRLPHRAQVPTVEQWRKLASTFGPLPADLSNLVHSTELVPVAEWETPDVERAGRNKTKKAATLSSGDYRRVTGYACACDTPDAPTRPAVVLDPFAGTGTTVMVARALGRYGVGLDLSADYLRLADWRVFRSGHAAKAIQRTNRENQGQLL